MKKFRLVNCYTAFLAASFLLLPLLVQAIDTNEAYVSSAEFYEVLDNSDVKYVYLGQEFSDLYEVVSRISRLENNKDSMLYALQKHIEDGFSIGLYDSVLEVLSYAEKLLEENASKMSLKENQEIARSLDMVINQMVNEALTIDVELVDRNVPFDEFRQCPVAGPVCPGPINCCRVITVKDRLIAFSNARFRKDVEINGKLKVYGKSVFKDDVKFEDDVYFEDHAYFNHDVTFRDKVKFKENVTFEENVNIEGTLSVTDLVVRHCMQSLCVNNLSVVNESISGTLSVNNEFANNITVGNLTATDVVITNLSVVGCLANLCVNNLSVTNETVTGILSVNNEIATNITVDSLSANNAIINTLSVVDCINNLCILNLSVVNEAVSGTLSVNNEFANNITVTNLSATNVVITDLSVIGCIGSLCVNNLSVINEIVSGTLSVNNEVVTNITATSLSATDAIITNETVTNLSATNAVIANLSVTNCMASLCVNNLSVVNESVTTLSVTDLVAGSIIIGCDLTVGCNISMNDSTSAAVGNIIKNGIPFMHNFGTYNTFLGDNAGNFIMSGSENVGVGFSALLSNTTGSENVAVGAFALPSNNVGTNNIALGAFALSINSTGNENTALGSFTLTTNTTGSGNTAIGSNAGVNLVSGNNNVFIGSNAASAATTAFTNVIIGSNSGSSLLTGNDNIYIANDGVASENGIIRIGTNLLQTATYIQGIFGVTVGLTGLPVFIDSTGQMGTVLSSRRFKHDIEDMDSAVSANIYKLRPVTFAYNSDATETRQYGLIAEEVDQILPELVVQDEEGKPYTVRYHLLPILLLNEVKQLNSTIQEQTVTMHDLKMDSVRLNEAMRNVIERINQLQIN